MYVCTAIPEVEYTAPAIFNPSKVAQYPYLILIITKLQNKMDHRSI